VVRTTQELLVAGTHKNDVRFTTEDAIIVEALCEFLSMKFRENELFNESQVLEEAGTYGYSLTLNDLRALNIDSRFLRDIHRHIVKHEIARRVVVAELEIFRQRSDLQTGTKGRVSIMGIQSRTKEFASIVEKMRRKRRHYSTFDDIAGVRIIVDYMGDISKVVDFIHHNKRFSICTEEDKISSPDETTRYRGYHITVQFGIELNDGTEDLAKCELQIRTTYQDSWSRKAHQLTYKKNAIPDNLRSLLALLSDQLHNADQQSEILRKSIEQTT
jgi:ppGpp synthetase/RelA/SpoT-type nucleotidyltranferase